MKFSDLISKIKTSYKIIYGANFLDEILLADIALDSRLVKENSAFFALKGKVADGNLFIADSIKKGACVIVSSDLEVLQKTALVLKNEKVLLIFSQNSFQLMVEFLQSFYLKLPTNIYAVTGTNGKTSVAEFCRQILQSAGKKAASIGTLGVICDNLEKSEIQNTALTTPDLVSFYKKLALLKKAGIDDVVLEVSSIGLEQSRIAGVKIAVGAFTNFTQDHLDYHQNMDKYFECKMLLFNSVLQVGDFAVLNSDIVEYEKIFEICQSRNLNILSYGFKANLKNSLKIKKILEIENGQKVIFEFLGEEYSFNLSVAGDFQAFNAICALAIFLSKNNLSKQELENLLQNFHLLNAALGRMQIVGSLKNKAQIFIDFAHTPDALSNVLELAKKISNNKARVLVLFGCGGDRDNKKRPIMGEVASRLADKVIVTDDNPRTEDGKKIRTEILSACNMTKTIEIADRKLAIKQAISMLQDYDILILAGKGHEKYQIIGDKKIEFDEAKIVKDEVKRLS